MLFFWIILSLDMFNNIRLWEINGKSVHLVCSTAYFSTVTKDGNSDLLYSCIIQTKIKKSLLALSYEKKIVQLVSKIQRQWVSAFVVTFRDPIR